MINDKFVQIQGPFLKGEELVDKILKNYPNFRGIKKIGIQSKIKHVCCINNKEFIIGKTEILEFNNVKITSLYFNQYESKSTLIDCILE